MTLIFSEHRTHIDFLVQAALEAADPGKALVKHWKQIPSESPVYLVGFGKASYKMALTAYELCKGRIVDSAIAAVPKHLGQADGLHNLNFFPALHPMPGPENIVAAQRIAAVAEKAANTPDATLIVLISGGGSAHLVSPAGKLTLENLQDMTRALMRAGANISELNTVRKHSEQLKGGGLAELAGATRIQVYVLSDVIGDPLDVIASGPTSPDPSTYADALSVLEKYQLSEKLPAIAEHLEAGNAAKYPETLTPEAVTNMDILHTVIGNNQMAVNAVREKAEQLGFHVLQTITQVEGEASEVGKRLAEDVINIPDAQRPACIIYGGETTVTVSGSGLGGRNQELALGASLAIDATHNVVVASFGTDGIDGPTDAAGAIVTGNTIAQAKSQGLDPVAYLTNNDSYHLFRELNTLISPGPTGTNVNDIAIGLHY